MVCPTILIKKDRINKYVNKELNYDTIKHVCHELSTGLINRPINNFIFISATN